MLVSMISSSTAHITDSTMRYCDSPRRGAPGIAAAARLGLPASGVALLDMDLHQGGETNDERGRTRLGLELDLHRDALHHLREVAGGGLGWDQRVLRARGGRE